MDRASHAGVGATRLLRSRSPLETAAFWIVLILFYVILSSLAGARGVGYTERFDPASESVSRDLNSFLWFPELVLRSDPTTNPVPFLLWWVVLSTLAAEGIMVLFRLRGAARVRPGPGSRLTPFKRA